MHGVVVVGSLSLDRVLTKDGATGKAGGVVTYGGITFARLGVETSAVFNLAQADLQVCGLFESEGVKLFVGDTAATTRFTNDIRGETRRQTVPALAEPIRAGDIQRALGGGVTHLHLGLLHWHDVETAFLGRLEGLRLTVSADIQGFLRRPQGEDLIEDVSPLLEPVLRAAAYAKASRRELAIVTSHFGLDASGIVREFGLRELIVTEGSAGGVIHDAASDETRYAAGPDEIEPVDTTGAGDVFFAAYLTHRLHLGDTVASAGRRAAEIATRHVHGTFLTEGSLSLDRRQLG